MGQVSKLGTRTMNTLGTKKGARGRSAASVRKGWDHGMGAVPPHSGSRNMLAKRFVART